MELDNESDFNKLEMELNSNEAIKDKLLIKKGEKLNPKIIIYGVNQKLNDDELINSIVAQNDLNEQNEIKLLFKMNNNKGKNVVMSCHHTTFNKIL